MEEATNNSAQFFNSTEKPPALAQETIKLVVQVTIALIGVVGNILVCIVISKQSRKKFGTNFYIQILSIADLLVLSINFPLAVIVEKVPYEWPFGEFVCRYLYPIPETFFGASVWTIVAIAVERYRGIVKGAPVKGEEVLKRVKKTTACLWLVSFMVFSLPLCFFMKYEETSTARICYVNWPDFTGENAGYKIYAVSLMLCSYLFPLAVFIWTYLSIIHRLRKSSVFIRTLRNGKGVAATENQHLKRSRAFSQTQGRRLHQNKRANKILTPVVVLFTISMFPLTFLRTVTPFWIALVSKPFFPNLIYVASVGATINSAANPLIYSVSCQDFRRELRDLICKTEEAKETIISSRSSSLRTTTL